MMALLLVWRLIIAPAALDSVTVWLGAPLAAAPRIEVVGGVGGAHCVGMVDDLDAPPYRCVVWAQDRWQRVIVDGQLLGERAYVYVPVLRR